MAANAQRPAVNQRLYMCRLQLTLLAEALQRKPVSAEVLEHAMAESSIFQLRLAYQYYLAEIATAYGLPCQLLSDANFAAQQLLNTGHESAEIKELQELEKTNDSWLSMLLNIFQAINKGIITKQSTSKDGVSLIAVVHEDITVSPCSLSTVNNIFECLQELIARQRGCLEEW